MIRRLSRALTATDLLTAEQQAQEAEYRRLAALKKRDEAQEARLGELAAGLLVEQMRFEVQTLNTLQYARYEANRRAVIGWVEEMTGLPWAKALQDPQGDNLADAGLRWALLNAAVTAVRRRAVRYLEPEPEDGWEPAEYAPLDSLAAFEGMPSDLSDNLGTLIASINPGLFRGPVDGEQAKKNAGISVG